MRAARVYRGDYRTKGDGYLRRRQWWNISVQKGRRGREYLGWGSGNVNHQSNAKGGVSEIGDSENQSSLLSVQVVWIVVYDILGPALSVT
jgi:hypothetical protein